MEQTYEMESGGFYLIESLSSGRSCYFESEEEIDYFRLLFKRYIGSYCKIYKMYLSSEGYRVFLKIRGRGVLTGLYCNRCDKNGVGYDKIFLKETWRIVSEQFRIFHSVYVKGVNRKRGRKGVLVQDRYRRYYFDSEDELRKYEKEMDERKEIKGQENERYRYKKEWGLGVNWGIVRSVGVVEGFMDKWFQRFVVDDLIKLTLRAHKPPN